MRSRQTFRGPRLVFFLAIFPLLIVGSRAANDDDEETDMAPPLPPGIAEVARRYAGVTEWQGFFEATNSGSVAWSNGGTMSGAKQVEEKSHGRFVIKRNTDGWDPKRGIFAWGGNNNEQSGEATASEDSQFSEWDKWGPGEEWRDQVSGSVPVFASRFEIWLTKENAGISVGSPDRELLRYERTGRSVTYMNRGDGKRNLAETSLNKTGKKFMFLPPLNPSYLNSAGIHRVAASGPGVLVFHCEGKSRADTQRSTPEITHRSRVILFPVYDDLEVEVMIEGYAEWRPEGSIEAPKKPGNSLVAKATLKSRNGKVKDLPEVKRFTFQLLDTSREPGICLNWPLNAKDEDYDLRFSAENRGKLTDSEQKLAVTELSKDAKEQPYAEAKIDSYDFGGRATLQVICELEDGREIVGLMKDEAGKEDLVRLPKMQGPGWIADSWRTKNKAGNLADNHDNEKVAGQKDNGDGYTLYEEYRGWVEKGKHIEGDPLQKDFFILNLIDADAKGGIALFGRLSKLRVHSRLIDGKEMS